MTTSTTAGIDQAAALIEGMLDATNKALVILRDEMPESEWVADLKAIRRHLAGLPCSHPRLTTSDCVCKVKA